MLAFLAPCAIALLPGYITSLISRNTSSTSSGSLFFRAIKIALFVMFGFLVVYALAGGLILIASELIKEYMKWVALIMGVAIIILGGLMLAGKDISLSLHLKTRRSNTESLEAFWFGIAYAIGALGCLFPLFLVVVLQVITAPTILIGTSYLVAYFAGMSLLLLLVIIMAVFAKDFLMKHLRKALPHLQKISGVLLIVAGIYIIQYQLILF